MAFGGKEASPDAKFHLTQVSVVINLKYSPFIVLAIELDLNFILQRQQGPHTITTINSLWVVKNTYINGASDLHS